LQVKAIDRPRKNPRDTGFPRPPRSAEQICMANLARQQLVSQRAYDMLLPNDFLECTRTSFAV